MSALPLLPTRCDTIAVSDSPETPWRSGQLRPGRGGPRLLFARMHEDCEIEASAFPPGASVFCIASAGCTALSLAASGRRVTAVDVNPEQIEHVRGRLDGSPCREGAVDRLLARARRFFFPLWASRARLEEFLSLSDPEAQARFWRKNLDTPVLRVGLALFLNRLALRAAYSRAFVDALPRRFTKILRLRLARGFARHPNRTNPYVRDLFLGRDPPQESAPAPIRMRLEVADAASYLEECPPGSFEGFSLSNILDGASAAYRERVFAAVRRASSPGGVLVLRSFSQPEDATAAAWAGMDRSMLWGSIRVERVSNGEPIPCSTS